MPPKEDYERYTIKNNPNINVNQIKAVVEKHLSGILQVLKFTR
jgi:hypothetical protein